MQYNTVQYITVQYSTVTVLSPEAAAEGTTRVKKSLLTSLYPVYTTNSDKVQKLNLDKMMDKNKDATEEVTPHDIMNFMSSFRTSMEEKTNSFRASMEEEIRKTNKKLDDRLDTVEEKIAVVNKKIYKNEGDGKEALKRMDARLGMLEKEMEKALKIKERREKIVEKEIFQPCGKEKEKEKRREETEKEKNQLKGSKMAANQREGGTQAEKERDPEEKGNYHSSWAQELERELSEAAQAEGGRQLNKGWDSANGRDRTEVPDRWDKLIPNFCPEKKLKVRRPPPAIVDWFGENTDTSEDNTDEDADWTEVERLKRNKQKKYQLKEKKLFEGEDDTAEGGEDDRSGPNQGGDARLFLEQRTRFTRKPGKLRSRSSSCTSLGSLRRTWKK